MPAGDFKAQATISLLQDSPPSAPGSRWPWAPITDPAHIALPERGITLPSSAPPSLSCFLTITMIEATAERRYESRGFLLEGSAPRPPRISAPRSPAQLSRAAPYAVRLRFILTRTGMAYAVLARATFSITTRRAFKLLDEPRPAHDRSNNRLHRDVRIPGTIEAVTDRNSDDDIAQRPGPSRVPEPRRPRSSPVFTPAPNRCRIAAYGWISATPTTNIERRGADELVLPNLQKPSRLP